MNRPHASTAALAASLALAACAGPKKGAPELADRLTPGIFLEEEPGERGAARGPARKVGPDGLQLTKVSEGFVPRLYEDAARFCTIAYGHLVKKQRCDGSEPPEFLAGVPEPRGAEMLASDMEKAERAVVNAVKVELTDAQYGALCDFVYNVGGGNFRSSQLLEVVNAKDFDAVAPQLRRWVKAGGKEWPGLKARRQREIELFYSGSREGVPSARGPELEPIDVRTGRASP